MATTSHHETQPHTVRQDRHFRATKAHRSNPNTYAVAGMPAYTWPPPRVKPWYFSSRPGIAVTVRGVTGQPICGSRSTEGDSGPARHTSNREGFPARWHRPVGPLTHEEARSAPPSGSHDRVYDMYGPLVRVHLVPSGDPQWQVEFK